MAHISITFILRCRFGGHCPALLPTRAEPCTSSGVLLLAFNRFQERHTKVRLVAVDEHLVLSYGHPCLLRAAGLPVSIAAEQLVVGRWAAFRMQSA